MSRRSNRISRAIRQTKKVGRLSGSLAKNARSVAALGVSSGVAEEKRGPIIASALNSPAASPEPARMKSAKALAAFSAGTTVFSSLMAAQLTWMKFGFTQARLLSMACNGLLDTKTNPFKAGRVFVEAAELMFANNVETTLDLSRTGQTLLGRAMTPFQFR